MKPLPVFRVLLASVCAFCLTAPAARAQVAFKAVHGVSSDAYQKWVNRIKREGYRLVYVSGYGIEAPQFAAVAVKDARPLVWEARHGLTSDEYQKSFNALSKKGYRLICVSGYRQGDSTRYASVWVKDNFRGRWEARHGLTSDEYQRTFDALTKQGLRPSHVVGYPEGNDTHFAAIFVPDQVKTWEARHYLTERQYQALYDKLSKKGYRPTSISAYPAGDETRFAAIFIRSATAWVACHNLTSEQYQAEFDRRVKEGYRPTQVVGYPWEGQIRYAAVFLRQRAAAGALPTSGTAVAELAGFDDAMQEFMQDRDIPGGTLAVMKGGRLVLSRGYGHADPFRGKLLGPDAPLRIASVVKPITLAALLKLIREGKLSYDTKPFVYLGVKPPPGQTMDKRLRDITVRHLIEHKGGWDRDAAGDPMFRSQEIAKALGKTGPSTPADIIRYMAGQPLQFDPGSKSVYSNFGYCVLGRVIEKASGNPYVRYVREDLLAPLGIKSVELGRSLPKDRNPREPVYGDPGSGPNVVDPASKAVVPAPDGTFYLEAMDAHGGLIASAPDLVRFLQAYWMSGQPRRPGEAYSFNFFGSLPGTWTVVIQRPDGVNIAALFNQRADSSGLSYDDIRDLLNRAADGVKKWPGAK